MATNEFLPFAIDPAANVISQGAWDALAARDTGFVAGVAQSAQLNKAWRQSSVMAAMLGSFIDTYGALDALDDGNVANLVRDLARSIQAGKFSYVVATGTANAWVLTPTPAVAAYAAGRVLWVKAPATNTSTTVTANISALGTRPLKKANGADPEIGDLVAGVWYPTIDDGTNICVVSPLPSDMVAALTAAPSPPQLNFFEMVTAGTQNVSSSVVTTVTDFALAGSKPSDAVFGAGGTITIGAKTAGVWAFNMLYNPSQVGGAPTTVQAYIYRNGASYLVVTIPGTFCSQSGIIRVAAGDTLSMAVWQNSGGARLVKNSAVTPYTFFNLYQISS